MENEDTFGIVQFIFIFVQNAEDFVMIGTKECFMHGGGKVKICLPKLLSSEKIYVCFQPQNQKHLLKLCFSSLDLSQYLIAAQVST